MSVSVERLLLQLAIAVFGVVPVSAGIWGILGGLDHGGFESQSRYLSGLLLGIGLAFWGMIPSIETRGREMWLLALIVFIGGLARLGTSIAAGAWDKNVVLPLLMELAVTPLLMLWREHLESRKV